MRVPAIVIFFGFLFACRDEMIANDASSSPADAVVAADAELDGGVALDAMDAMDAMDVMDASTSTDTADILVLLDGAPSPNTLLLQGGGPGRWITDATGHAIVTPDRSVPGDLAILASHPDARIRGVMLDGHTPYLIELQRFDRSDFPDYHFGDPGEPTHRPNTSQCGHCHQTIDDDWFASPHRRTAKNPIVHDLYAGAAHVFDNEAACIAAGGLWREGLAPGTGTAQFRCYLGDGLLATINPACTEPPCEAIATEFGGCADCHAPAIDGVIGGRNLLEATGIAYDYGVSCDVCHRVEAIDESGAPGVAGRLRLLRPSEPGAVSLGAGGRLPLTFGPDHDVPNPRMGLAQRDHFREARFCSGCHQLDEPVRVAGQSIDRARWPSGQLPMQSTWLEWERGPMNPAAPCQSCHMPPNPAAANGADLQLFLPGTGIGYQGGWYRAPGAVARHVWYGPRQPASGMLEMAAAIFIDKKISSNSVTASVRVKNTGAGHAIPTGEPMRSLFLVVSARCGAEELAAVGGDAVPDFGGYLERKPSSEDWNTWAGARPGDRVRVISRSGGYYDYLGFGPFGDGTFDAAQKGMPVEAVIGFSTITSTTSSTAGGVSFDRPLPAGDVAYRVAAEELAGGSGFGFARVLVDANGRRRVFGFRAVDVASDNRLLPQKSWTSRHVFAATCADPIVSAKLVYRPYGYELAKERGWALGDAVIAEVRR